MNVSKFLGFLLGIAVALVGPAMFGVLAADGGIRLNAKEMALAYGIGALIFWAVVSYFSGAAALGAALTFGAMIYTVHWIPNRMTNFLNDVPGVTTGMIDGIKQYTLNGVVPILAVISLIFGIQLIVQAVRKRRRERVEAERLQREQEAAVQAQQMPVAPVAAAYPVAGGDYQPDSRFGSNFGNNNYDDLFEDEPVPVQPRNQADEHTAQFAPAPYSEAGEVDETRLVPTDADETVMVPSAEKTVADGSETDETVTAPPQADEAATQQAPVSEPEETQPMPVAEAPKPAAPQAAETQSSAPDSEAQGETRQGEADVAPQASEAQGGVAVAPQTGTAQGGVVVPQSGVARSALPKVDEGATQPMPVSEPEAPTPAPPQNDGSTPRGAAYAATPATPPVVRREEEMGQQYRERMDPPDVDDTGEFHLGAFENPGGTVPMELPGQFRPAGT